MLKDNQVHSLLKVILSHSQYSKVMPSTQRFQLKGLKNGESQSIWPLRPSKVDSKLNTKLPLSKHKACILVEQYVEVNN
jgi:hypothetical protein